MLLIPHLRRVPVLYTFLYKSEVRTVVGFKASQFRSSPDPILLILSSRLVKPRPVVPIFYLLSFLLDVDLLMIVTDEMRTI